MKHVRTVATLLIAFFLGALVLSDSADAAVRSLLLGQDNPVTRMTTLTNTGGTALYLRAPAGKPALAVNNTARVTRLNSDLLDGLNSTAFSRTLQSGMLIGGDPVWSPPRGYVTRVWCPAGTVRTGGGYDMAVDASSPGVLNFQSHPVEPRGWEVVSNYKEGTKAYVVCLSFNGRPVPGTTALTVK